jgi:hypothetical protein
LSFRELRWLRAAQEVILVSATCLQNTLAVNLPGRFPRPSFSLAASSALPVFPEVAGLGLLPSSLVDSQEYRHVGPLHQVDLALPMVA